MKKCAQCGTEVPASGWERIPEFDHDFMGIPVVLVHSVYRVTCSECGHSITAIPDQAGLNAAVALKRVLSPIKLNGAEFRFLRKTLGMKASELGRKLEIRAETISRWE